MFCSSGSRSFLLCFGKISWFWVQYEGISGGVVIEESCEVRVEMGRGGCAIVRERAR